MRYLVLLSLSLLLAVATLHQAHASPPGEKVVCSDPGERASWMSEAPSCSPHVWSGKARM